MELKRNVLAGVGALFAARLGGAVEMPMICSRCCVLWVVVSTFSLLPLLSALCYLLTQAPGWRNGRRYGLKIRSS